MFNACPRCFLGAGSLTGALGNPCQAWIPEKCCSISHQKPGAEEGCSGGLQENQLTWAALQPPGTFAVRWVSALRCQRLSPPCRTLSSTWYVSAWSPWGQRSNGSEFALPPFQGCRKRDLPPPNQLCDVDTTYELHTWVRTAVGSGQAILRCPQRWQKAELETMGGSPGQLAAGGGARQGAAPAEIPCFLTLRPRAAAQGWHQLGLRWEKTGRGDPDTLHVYLAPRSDNLFLCRSPPWDPESSTAGHGMVRSHLSWMSL